MISSLRLDLRHRAAAPRIVTWVALLLVLGATSVQAKSDGGYTNEQASRGAAVYTQYCVQCHGANLQGEAGTPLMGRTFLQAYGTGTAAQLYDFLSRQMPLNAPGSLSQKQYLDVTAFILERNGLPPGATPLSTASLGQVSLARMRCRGPEAHPIRTRSCASHRRPARYTHSFPRGRTSTSPTR